MPPTTDADIARLKRLKAADMVGCVLKHSELKRASAIGLPEISEFPIIGAASPDEGLDAGQMSWPHGFHLRHFAIDPGAATRRHTRAEEEVILMHKGRLSIGTDDGDIEVGPGDVFTIPIGSPRSFANLGDEPVEAFVVRGGDHPQAAQLADMIDE